MSDERSNNKLAWRLFFVVIGMFGFGFALVPLYNTMCRTLGINGKTDATISAASQTVDTSRVVQVEFLTTKAGGLPWQFKPVVHRVAVHPGEMKKVNFYAENQSTKTMSVQAIPSVTPGVAAKYFKKTECFCFVQQTLKSHESMDMPLLFHLDVDLPKNVNTVTLSYTLYNITSRVSGG